MRWRPRPEPSALVGIKAREWVPLPDYGARGPVAYVYDPGRAWPLPQQPMPRGWPGWTDSVIVYPRFYSPFGVGLHPAPRVVPPPRAGRPGGR